MSENIARYNVILELITQQQGDIDRIKREATGLQGTFNNAKAAYAGIIAAQATQFALTSIQGIINKGIDLAAQFETNSQSFKVLLGDMESAKTLIAELNKFSIQTPFEPAEIQASAKTLLGFGRTAKDVNEDIKIIGNASAATGASLQGLSLVFGQVAGVGRLMGQDALQFINQGIPVYQILAESLGKSVDEVKKLQEQGKITFDVLREAFVKASQDGGKFAGALEAQSKTFQGLLSTFRGNVDEAFKSVGEVILPLIKPLIAQAGAFFDGLIKQIQENKDRIQSFFQDTIDFVVPVAKVISTAFLTVTKIIIGLVAILVSIPRFIKENQTAFKALGVALVALNAHLIVSRALLIANNLALIAKYGTLTRAAQGVTLLRSAQLALNAAFRANPIGIVITAVSLLVAGFDILYNKSENVRAATAGLVNVAKNLKSIFDGGFVNVFSNIRKLFNDGFDDYIRQESGKGANRGSFSGYKETVERLAKERLQREADEKKKRDEAARAAKAAAEEALRLAIERNKQLEAAQIQAVEKNFALREQTYRDTIKDEEELTNQLKRLELEKQIAILSIKRDYSRQSSGKFLTKEDELNFIEFGNQIKKLEADYAKLFEREKISPLELLPPAELNQVSKQVDILRGELIKLTGEFNRVSDPTIKENLLQQITELRSNIQKFQLPDLSVNTFITGGFDALDITDIAPEKQVSTLEARLKLISGALDQARGRFKAGTASVTDLENFDALTSEYKKILEILERIGQKKVDVFGLSEAEIQQIQQGVGIATDAFSTVTDIIVENLDRQISAQDERVQKATEIAEKGNVDQLKLEEERLRQLEEKRRAASERQLILEKAAAQAQIVLNTALTISNIQAAAARTAAETGVAAPVVVPITLAILGGLIASAANLFKPPTFWLGTEEVGKDPQFTKHKIHSGRDGYWARFDGSERIVDGATNEKLNGIPNHLLPRAVEVYQRVMDYPRLAFEIPGPSRDNKKLDELNQNMIEMRKAFESLNIKTKLDVDGFTQYIERRIDKVTRRKKIRG